jgi:uncharacterized protein (TIGR02145 family)
MIDNSKEGTPIAKQFDKGGTNEKPEGLRGYYYTWEQAASACPEGFSLPTNSQYSVLQYVVNSSAQKFSLWYNDGQAVINGGGHYQVSTDAWGWFENVYTWCTLAHSYCATTRADMRAITPGRTAYYMQVRCVMK